MRPTLLFLCIALTCARSSTAQTKPAASFNVAAVEADLRFLAADEMKGRKLYSPELDKAADFIAASFKKSGLQPLAGNSFLQSFALKNARLAQLDATIDGKTFSKDQVIAITGTPELNVTEQSGYNIITIAADASFFQEAYGAVMSDRNNIVLVDESFADDFNKLNYFNRDFLKRTATTVFVLGKPKMEHYTIKATYTIKEQRLANVAGVLPGKSKKGEYVIFSSHYDHLGIGKPVEADSIYNGANDDASGTTAVMQLAAYFGKQRNNERSIIFVAFTGEESGGFGSQYFSEQLDPAAIVAMLNIEMIGTESKWGRNSTYITGYELSSLGAILQKNLEGSGFEFYPDPYPAQNLFYRSDNATLARLGVPAHTISTSKMDNEPFYHRPGDEVKTLDIKNMTEIIRSIGISASSIIAGKDTPTRIKDK